MLQGGSSTGSLDIQAILDLFQKLNPENQSKILQSGMLPGLPGLTGNSNNEGSTTPQETEKQVIDPNIVAQNKTGFFANAKDKLKDLGGTAKEGLKQGIKDFGKSFKDPNGMGSTMVNMGVDVASAKMNEGLKNSKGFDMANGALSTIADVGQGTWVGYAASAAQLGLNAINSANAKETDKISIDQETREEMGGSYSGSYSDMDEAVKLSGEYGGTNKKAFEEAQEKIQKGNQMQTTIQDINAGNESRQAMAGNVQLNQMRRAQQLNGGIDFTQLRAAKQGIKLNNINRVKNLKLKSKVNVDTKSIESVKEFKKGGNIDFVPIINDNPIKVTTKFVPIISDEIVIFKDGGKTEENELVKLEETNQKNVIPEGALHKNKHHIENTEGLTQKGIPVIDNDGEQQAEIELDEIIFTLEVTKKLEELHKIYKEGTNKERDEAAIEAGKLLVQEILYNTDDRTGLISKCEKGGKLNGNIE